MERLAAVTALSTLLVLVAPSPIHAACEGSKRISDDKANCLDTQQWESKSFFGGKSHARAWNICPKWGKVVAKVNIKNGTDETWTLSDGKSRTGSWSFPKKVRDISCCSDLSDLCTKPRHLTVQTCAAEFQRSSASLTCFDRSYSPDGESCTIHAQCENIGRVRKGTSIAVQLHEIRKIVNCDGRLKLGSC